MNDHDNQTDPHDATHADGPLTWGGEQLLLTAEEAARALHVGRTTLYALIRDGQLRAVHIGRSCRLTRVELLRYVERLNEVEELGAPPSPPTMRSQSGRRSRPPMRQVRPWSLDKTPPDAA